MVPGEISSRVERFLAEYVDSVELLHVLLLLHGRPDRAWTLAEITHELRSVESSIEKRLHDLYARGVLGLPAPARPHRFSPASDEMRAVIDELAECFAVRPYRIIELIYARPADPLRALADAFKFRKDN